MINSTNQNMSDIPDIDVFNLWIENDTDDIGYSPQSTYEEDEVKPIIEHTGLKKRIDALKSEIRLRRYELDLALVEREVLSAQIRYTKKRAVKAASFRKKIELEQRKPIRINGVSNRCGSYTNILQQLSASPFFCH